MEKVQPKHEGGENNNNNPSTTGASNLTKEEMMEIILGEVENVQSINSNEVATKQNWDHLNVLTPVLTGMVALELISTKVVQQTAWHLTAAGLEIIQSGAPEVKLFKHLKANPDGLDKKQAEQQFTDVAVREALKLKWVRYEKASNKLFADKPEVEDPLVSKLSALDQVSANDLKLLKRRDLVEEKKVKTFIIEKGPKYARRLVKKELELTDEMITSGSWATKEFKAYNFNALGRLPNLGHLHPLLKTRSAFREIFLELGFEEMPTNQYIESSLWNFDALYTAQQHPVRDIQDTFFISDPATTLELPMDFVAKTKAAHENGGESGSLGWRYEWSLAEAQKNILRTHTTAISVRMLYKLAEDYKKTGVFTPKKYFSIDKVFRNEEIDPTHLAEFYQMEGVVADYGLTLGDLIGIISKFFNKYGFSNITFKPAYNPYTEPSAEVYGWHEGRKKMMEIGNSGIFRPELIVPLGLPEGVNVIAWGLGLERPTMIRSKLSDIREMEGEGVKIKEVEENPICDLQLDDVSYYTPNNKPF